MKILHALAPALILTSCAGLLAYHSATERHGTTFVAPKDSSDVMWARAQQWFTMGSNRPALGPVSGVMVQSVPTSVPGEDQISVTRFPAGDSVRYQVTSRHNRGGAYDSGGSPQAYRQTLQLSYWIHYGIDETNFPTP